LRLELTDLGDHIKVRVEVHRSPVGHSWDIELRHDRGINGSVPGSFKEPRLVFFEGTRLASESGDLTVQRRVWNSWMMDRVAAKVRDRRTGQFGIFCHVGAGVL
jgi:hypothetical protein